MISLINLLCTYYTHDYSVVQLMTCYQASCHKSQALLGVYCILKGHFLHKLISIKIPGCLYNGQTAFTGKETRRKKEIHGETRPNKASIWPAACEKGWGESPGDVSVWAAVPNHILHTAPRPCGRGIPISRVTKHHLTATFIIMMA